MGYCPDEVHMDEEEVQVQVQAEEEEIGETHEREQGEETGERTNNQVAHMDHYADGTKRAPTLEPYSVMCNNECVFTAREKVTCEVYCLHSPSVAADCYQL